jgi:hypothetical protein
VPSSGVSAANFHEAPQKRLSVELMSQLHDKDNVAAKTAVQQLKEQLGRADKKTGYHHHYFRQLEALVPYLRYLRDHLSKAGSMSKSMRGSASAKTKMMDTFCPCVFSIETTATGTRKYLLTSFPKFIHKYYRETPPGGRNHYEVRQSERSSIPGWRFDDDI